MCYKIMMICEHTQESVFPPYSTILRCPKGFEETTRFRADNGSALAKAINKSEYEEAVFKIDDLEIDCSENFDCFCNKDLMCKTCCPQDVERSKHVLDLHFDLVRELLNNDLLSLGLVSLSEFNDIAHTKTSSEMTWGDLTGANAVVAVFKILSKAGAFANESWKQQFVFLEAMKALRSTYEGVDNGNKSYYWIQLKVAHEMRKRKFEAEAQVQLLEAEKKAGTVVGDGKEEIKTSEKISGEIPSIWKRTDTLNDITKQLGVLNPKIEQGKKKIADLKEKADGLRRRGDTNLRGSKPQELRLKLEERELEEIENTIGEEKQKRIKQAISHVRYALEKAEKVWEREKERTHNFLLAATRSKGQIGRNGVSVDFELLMLFFWPVIIHGL